MNAFPKHNRRYPTSLQAKILKAEHRVLSRKQQLGLSSANLIHSIKQGITTPPHLLLAAGIGFLLAELSSRPSLPAAGTNIQASKTSPSPLAMIINTLNFLHGIYSALPLIWAFKSWFDRHTPPDKDTLLKSKYPEPMPVTGSANPKKDRSRGF